MALTIRLTEKELDDLIEIKTYLGENTSSGTIKRMIETYLEMKDFLHDEQSKNSFLIALSTAQKERLLEVKTFFKFVMSDAF